MCNNRAFSVIYNKAENPRLCRFYEEKGLKMAKNTKRHLQGTKQENNTFFDLFPAAEYGKIFTVFWQNKNPHSVRSGGPVI